MTWVIAKLTWANLINRPMSTFLTVATLLVAVSLISILLQFTAFVDQRLEKDTAGVDLIIGAKGSPLQLVLSALYHVDVPPGNIPLKNAQAIMRDPQIRRTTPLALGDSFRGYRVVGTLPSFLNLYGSEVAEGNVWKHPQQVVIGSRIHHELGMDVGQKFVTTHGLASADADAAEHEQAPYEVVGILAPTGSVVDRLIVTSVDSVWHAHGTGHEGDDHDDDHAGHDDHDELIDLRTADPTGREVTALLIEYRSPIAAVRLPRIINSQQGLQAAVPAIEITRLFSLSEGLVSGARVLGIIFVLIGGLSIFVTVSNATSHKTYDIALLRSMGARPTTVFMQQLIEGTAIAVISGAFGILFAHLILFIASLALEPLQAIGLNGGLFTVSEIYLFVGTVFVGIIAVMWPAARSYRLDPIILLKRGR
jgi:putative ABC transport system permease protein